MSLAGVSLTRLVMMICLRYGKLMGRRLVDFSFILVQLEDINVRLDHIEHER